MTRTGEREIGAISGRVGKCNNHFLTAVHETVMQFFKPDVKKKKKRKGILLFTVCFV